MSKYNVVKTLEPESSWIAAFATAAERTRLDEYLTGPRLVETSLTAVMNAVRSKLDSLVTIEADQGTGLVQVKSSSGFLLAGFQFVQVPDELFSTAIDVTAVNFVTNEAAYIAAGGTAEGWIEVQTLLTVLELSGSSPASVTTTILKVMEFPVTIIQNQANSSIDVIGGGTTMITMAVATTPSEMFE